MSSGMLRYSDHIYRFDRPETRSERRKSPPSRPQGPPGVPVAGEPCCEAYTGTILRIFGRISGQRINVQACEGLTRQQDASVHRHDEDAHPVAPISTSRTSHFGHASDVKLNRVNWLLIVKLSYSNGICNFKRTDSQSERWQSSLSTSWFPFRRQGGMGGIPMTARGVHLNGALTSTFLGACLTHCDTLRHHAAAMMAKNPARGTVARAAGSGRRRALGGLRPAGATRAISYRFGFEALFRMGDRPVRSHKAVRERLFKYGALGLACGSYGGETGAPGRKPWCGLRRV